ncbi:IS630 family transposase, partial [Candidatus Poribacteria bacterium]|nr:IS630 family transposase [Candidatus Poribacteria bacterium]
KPPEIIESVSELKRLIRKSPYGFQKQRITMLYLYRSGQVKTRKDASKMIGVHRKTIGTWLSTYASEGLDGLLKRDYSPGRPSQLSKEQQELFREKLKDPEGFSNYQQITDYIEKTYGVKMSYHAVHVLVRYKLDAKLKVPRKSHEKNEEACDKFKLNFGETIKTAISDKDSSFETIRNFCQDETRIGLLPVSNRRITLSGIKPVTKVNYTFESFYLYGAVEPITGQSFFIEMPWLNGSCFRVFLDEFAKVYPSSLNILVLDNGRFHHGKSLQIPDNVALVFLPPYSPELNPIERLWQDTKAKLFENIFTAITEMQNKLTEILCKYTETTIASITNAEYITKVANGI